MAKRLGIEVNGNNQMGTLETYLKRLLYDSKAYRENTGGGPEGVVDFQFGERMMYGRINRSGMSIVYANRGTRHIPAERGRTVEMVNFVADAFTDMSKKIDRDKRMGVIPPNAQIVSNLIPKASYVPASKLYSEYSSSLYKAYDAYIRKYKLRSKLKGIESHYMIYQEFLAHLLQIGFNVSLSGYVRSRRANPRISGLIVDLDLFNFGDDKDKLDFIDSKFFKYYVNVAKSYGFSVDKHIPTRLVANLDSPYMQKYTIKYSAPSANDVIRLHYKSAWGEGYKIFKKDMINFYNRYVKENPYSSSRRRTRRHPVHVQRQMDTQGEEFFLRIYIEMRNREESSILAHAEKEYLKKRASDLIKIRGISKAVEYAEKEFSRFAMEGNTAASIRKRLTENLDD